MRAATILSSSYSENPAGPQIKTGTSGSAVRKYEVQISCAINSAKMVDIKYLCGKRFSVCHFTIAERVHLNTVAFPYCMEFAAQSLPNFMIVLLF
jgi:hypothetical protein